MASLKFRGQNIKAKKWHYGHYCKSGGIDVIVDDFTSYSVKPETIGQQTPFKDADGKDIYGGDILGDWNVVDDKKELSSRQVYFCKNMGAWLLDNTYKQDKSDGDLLCRELALYQFVITGNIHQK